MKASSSIVLCAALKRLKNEHIALRAKMDAFYEITEDIEYDDGPAACQHFAGLREHISAFSVLLQAHSRREEEELFPLLARRLGAEDQSIEEMEFEHEKAERHLCDFLREADQEKACLDEDIARSVTVYAVQAYATLTQHFAKEENMLFPLAESILTNDEKVELLEALR